MAEIAVSIRQHAAPPTSSGLAAKPQIEPAAAARPRAVPGPQPGAPPREEPTRKGRAGVKEDKERRSQRDLEAERRLEMDQLSNDEITTKQAGVRPAAKRAEHRHESKELTPLSFLLQDDIPQKP